MARYTSRVQLFELLLMAATDRVTAAYDSHYGLLRGIAGKFGVPQQEVEPLIHNVFVAFLRHEHGIRDDRQWLVTAICNAARQYLRDRHPTEPLPETLVDPRELADDVQARIDVERLLANLPKRCRAVLWLRFVHGLDPAEIAATCAASESAGYGRQLVHRCLQAARQALVAGARRC